ncbi:MAG TPA: hypothetical protein VG076_19130 [Acidimicrobiales bacterium]|nr:hypothetical protein [Acidimicrobiales bacterium]
MIDKLMRARIVVGAGIALLMASGVAVAATNIGSRPAAFQEETSTSSTSVDPGSTTSTSVDDSTTSTTATTEATTSTTVAAGGGATTTTAPEAEGDNHDNHGACVSQAAHDTPPGPDHGKTVSSVAQSDCGKDQAQPGTTSTTENENEAPEQENEATEQQNEQHGSQSGDHGGSSGSDHGNGNGHGGPGQG